MFGLLCTFDEIRPMFPLASSEVVVVYSDPSFCCHSCDTLHVTKGTEINNEMQVPRQSFSNMLKQALSYVCMVINLTLNLGFY